MTRSTPNGWMASWPTNGHLMLVALYDGLVISQLAAVVHRHPDQPTELYLDNLAVASSHRRQGIAARLLDEALALRRAYGCAACGMSA